MTERIVNSERVEDLIAVFGSFDENIRRIEDALEVKIVNRGTDLKVSGDEENVDKALNDIQDKYAKTITNTYTRFAGAVTVDTFKQELDYIREFFEERPEYITGKYLEEYISK